MEKNEAIRYGMMAIERSVKEYHDWDIAAAIINLCQIVGGNKFHVEFIPFDLKV